MVANVKVPNISAEYCARSFALLRMTHGVELPLAPMALQPKLMSKRDLKVLNEVKNLYEDNRTCHSERSEESLKL